MHVVVVDFLGDFLVNIPIYGGVLVVIIYYLDLLMQSVPITTNVVSSNPTQAIQHYVIDMSAHSDTLS
jgi:hypothetical protein